MPKMKNFWKGDAGAPVHLVASADLRQLVGRASITSFRRSWTSEPCLGTWRLIIGSNRRVKPLVFISRTSVTLVTPSPDGSNVIVDRTSKPPDPLSITNRRGGSNSVSVIGATIF